MEVDNPLGEALKKIAGKSENAPDSLQAEVFSTLEAIRLLADVANLFTVKFAQTELQALDAAFLAKEEGEKE